MVQHLEYFLESYNFKGERDKKMLVKLSFFDKKQQHFDSKSGSATQFVGPSAK